MSVLPFAARWRHERARGGPQLVQLRASSAIARCDDSLPFGIASSWPAPSTMPVAIEVFAFSSLEWCGALEPVFEER